jgi:hypothetical protein
LPRYSDNYFVSEQGFGSGLPSTIERDKVRFVTNNGSNLRDYFDFIIENYDSLPEVVFLVKGNVFPRHVRQHVFNTYTSKEEPCSIVDRKKHRTTFPLDFFGKSGKYCELNSDPYSRADVPSKYFQSLNQLLSYFVKGIKPQLYTKFSIGGQFVSTQSQIRSLPKWVYEDLREIVSHGGGPIGYTIECWIVERALDRLWENSDQLSVTRNSDQKLIPHKSGRAQVAFSTRILFAVLDLVARILRLPIRGRQVVGRAINNRTKLVRNVLTK